MTIIHSYEPANILVEEHEQQDIPKLGLCQGLDTFVDYWCQNSYYNVRPYEPPCIPRVKH